MKKIILVIGCVMLMGLSLSGQVLEEMVTTLDLTATTLKPVPYPAPIQ